MYMADLLPSVGHIPLPYVMAYDMFPLETLAREKKTVLQRGGRSSNIFYLWNMIPVKRMLYTDKTPKEALN